ncbi:recombinase family protein [Clostridium estertheticum]|uniref:recombinase family protein n=1 Tax=Clostridium estertheticum TaxID=238834 RepID=UPI001CF20779|nr:recombinase family protein [Clostridium estertheticum]MCB2359930.1 recombinase family protein [Clostridium estertheticum]
MMLGFMQNISQEESRIKSEIIKWGKKRAAESGIVSLQSEVYGYQSNLKENTLRIIPEEAEVIKQIFNLALEGNGVRTVKRILTEQNTLNKKGELFKDFHLLYILKNPKYCGLNVRNRYEKVDLYNSSKQKERPPSEWIVQETDKIDKIITKEIFDNVQKQILSRASVKRGVNNPKGELARKLKCSVCGSFYRKSRQVRKDGSFRVFYHCGNKKMNGIKACNSRNVTQEEIEENIDKYINGAYYESIHKKVIYDYIIELYNRRNEILNQKNYENSDELEEIKNKIKVNEENLSKLVEIMIETTTDTLTKVYANKTKDIQNNLIPLEKRLKELETTEEYKNEEVAYINRFILELSDYKLEKYSSREDFLEKLTYFTVHDKTLMAHTKLDQYLIWVKAVIYGDITKFNEDMKEYATKVSKQLML